MPRTFRTIALALLTVAMAGLSEAGYAVTPVPAVAVSPQYDTTHVYVAPADFDRFTMSLIATFGGSKARLGVFQVTPTPSQTMSQLVFTPVGTFSVFGFKTPIPYPFGLERTGYLVSDMDLAVESARKHGADVIVSTFPDPIGRDAIIEWPGGLHMQLYWHTTAPQFSALQTIPENRVYLSKARADAFVHGFVAFSQGKVVADDAAAPGIEIGDPDVTYRSVRLESSFGKINVFVTDGHLPYPYGHEISGYEVIGLAATLEKAKASGATVLVPPFVSRGRQSALLQFPGGYIAEIHSPADK
jgi:predicted enzyme related to lactoylglutathione lyase